MSKLSSRIHQHLRSLGSMTKGERELVCGALIRALAWHGRHPWKHESDRSKSQRWRAQLRVLTEALHAAGGDVKHALLEREETA